MNHRGGICLPTKAAPPGHFDHGRETLPQTGRGKGHLPQKEPGQDHPAVSWGVSSRRQGMFNPKAVRPGALRSQNRSSPPNWPRQGTPPPERTGTGSHGRLVGRVFLTGGDAHPKGSSLLGTSMTEGKLPPKLTAARDTSPRKNRDRVTRPSTGTGSPWGKRKAACWKP